MVFLYSKFSGDEFIELDGDEFRHLKVRRVKLGDRVDVRNLKDGYNYIYEIKEFDRRKATLELVFKHSVIVENESNLTLAWAVVEPAVIEKTLPLLNELGVKNLYFVYTEFSQKNYKLDFERMERILINSSQQCGRNSIINLEIFGGFDEFVDKFSNVSLINFGGKSLNLASENELFFIGPEGGFSVDEALKVKTHYALNTSNILRSNTAIVSVAAKFII
ncbi:MAG: 16S rRNA (uracil(1498)-N(3))-methyltransferase [Campylobacteraceae bacterium]|nr:16S rRNA (uracil(1498)-N(3))-methyltransferase [Campylobacteraceae bacterium]